jgi:parvulin-like peptidyl-prolyl isomerase
MSFRTRPVLDRKHRPRWQDELRTQQLTIVGFALAIALALGIFGASAWNGYWDRHFRPVAAAAGQSFDRSDLNDRIAILSSELLNQATELQAQLSGSLRDQLIQQQLDQLQAGFNTITGAASQSLVDGAVLASRAADFDVGVTDDEIDAEIAKRSSFPERIRASLILIDPLPDDAEPGAEPTAEQKAAATAAAQDAKDRIEGGASFANVATEVSDDASKQVGGDLGWFRDGDPAYGAYFDALADADEGDLVGPIEVEGGSAVLQLVTRRPATADGGLHDLLVANGIDDAEYRDYIRSELLRAAFQTHFEDVVVQTPVAQRRVAQITINAVTGTVVPQERARHILIQPDPEIDNQADATDEQWAAALAEAREVEDLVRAPDADWWTIAEEHSDDTGSAARGGDLGWYDPEDMQFVRNFAAELASLEVGEISDPIRTEFGYHVIQKTAERDSPQAEAADLVAQLREDPDSFGDVARDVSEDGSTARKNGELGWVAPYQLTKMEEDAIFNLAEVGDISEPIDEGTDGITIYKLLEVNDRRAIDDNRLARIKRNGLARWIDEVVRNGVESWIDPEFAPSGSTTG